MENATRPKALSAALGQALRRRSRLEEAVLALAATILAVALWLVAMGIVDAVVGHYLGGLFNFFVFAGMVAVALASFVVARLWLAADRAQGPWASPSPPSSAPPPSPPAPPTG